MGKRKQPLNFWYTNMKAQRNRIDDITDEEILRSQSINYNLNFKTITFPSDTPILSIERKIRENPEKYIDELSEKDWIRVSSNNYKDIPPNSNIILKSASTEDKKKTNECQNLWKEYRKTLLNKQKKKNDLYLSEISKVKKTIKDKKEQEKVLKRYLELHKMGLITKEALTNLQVELLSNKKE
jgi:hypothetical protein